MQDPRTHRLRNDAAKKFPGNHPEKRITEKLSGVGCLVGRPSGLETADENMSANKKGAEGIPWPVMTCSFLIKPWGRAS
jgi:hypothetical protein